MHTYTYSQLLTCVRFRRSFIFNIQRAIYLVYISDSEVLFSTSSSISISIPESPASCSSAHASLVDASACAFACVSY